jgi:serine/threonine-protein kinase
MASVWAALQRGKHGFEKVVAIKTTLPKFARDQRFRRMFLDEARIASRIEHPNVARIVDLGEEDGVLFIAMEYIDGESVSSLNRASQKNGTRLAPGVLLRILADTCAGLHEAHELADSTSGPLGIVHCDVSPDNILIDPKGVAKLIDFGIAKILSRVGEDSDSGTVKGKARYMAPEQALGRSVGRRADLWSVGAILDRLLIGNVHPAITAIAVKALSYAPESRYATAADMREALERAMCESDQWTTTDDVAAFCRRHLGERAEKRRRALASALASISERRQIEDTGPESAIVALPRARVSRAPLPAAPETPAPKTASSALGTRRPRRLLLVASALAVLGMGIVTGVVLQRHAAKKQGVTAEPPQVETDIGPPPGASSMGTAATAISTEWENASNVPVVPASALPRASPPARAAVAAPKPAVLKKQIIDDGF